MNIDDDTLIAYLDAQLEDDAAYETVEDALAASPALRSPPPDAPPSPRAALAVAQAPPARAPPASAHAWRPGSAVVSAPPRPSPRWSRWRSAR